MDDSYNAVDLNNLSLSQRFDFINEQTSKITDFDGIEQEFQFGKKFEKLLLEGLPVHKLIEHKTVSEIIIRELFQKFKEDFINNALNPNESVFTIFNTPELAKANAVTRSLSTKLGNVWEDVAFLSPKVISLEKLFKKKIKGVDIIVTGDFTFCQLKTKKDTLTGSQTTRSEKELQVYERRKFVAALDLGRWTFNSPVVTRVAGKEFWDTIDIDYNYIINETKKVMISLEEFLTK